MKNVKIYQASYLLPIAVPPIEDGALLVRDGRIAAVGRGRELAVSHPGATVVDFGDAILLPPFANAHTHLELTHFPRWAALVGETTPPASFVDWILQVIRVKRGLTLARYQDSLEAGIAASLAAGTGAVGDILSYFPARQAYRTSPLKGVLFLETLGLDPLKNREILGSIGRILAEEKAGNLRLGLSPHAPYTLSAEHLEEVLDLARRRRVPVAVHLAESPDETAFLKDSGGPLAGRLYPFVGWGDMVPPPAGCTPITYLDRLGGLQPWVLPVHGVQARKEDVELLARRGAGMVLCPRSNARLGVGRAPVGLYLQAGVPLALGTDSLASSDSLSLWDEIAFARRWFEGSLSPPQLVTMATLGGARALGLEGEMGVLATGQAASFQVLKPKKVPAAGELFEFLCSPGRTAEVAALYLNGRDVLQNGVRKTIMSSSG